MKVHAEPIQYVIRGYSSGSYEERSPYDFVLTLTVGADGEGFLRGMHGKFSAEAHRAIRDKLMELGIKVVRYDRRGKIVEALSAGI